MQHFAIWLSFLTIIFLLRVLLIRRSQKPPGPYRLPIIGNAHQMPLNYQWEKFAEWAKVYGDITYLEVIGQPIAVINSSKLANELLDKRSASYSSRPHLVMASKLSKFMRFFAVAPYGEQWRHERKLVSFSFSKSMVPNYYPLQEAEARKLVQSLLENPEDLFAEVKLRIGTIVMRVIYGYYPKSASDPLLTCPIRSVINFGVAFQPGVWLVDSLPFLQYLPSWAPGMEFLQTAKRFETEAHEAVRTPYLWFQENLTAGKTKEPNICSTMLSSTPGGVLSREDEDRLPWALGSVLGGALDTNISTILSFFLLMSLHPEVQRKAQEEIDQAIGRDRLPSIEDRTRLPYVRNIIVEVMRLCPALPLAIPHSLIQDDIFADQFYLPKDTIVIPNIWGMLRDPEVFPQPNVFDPDRYNLSDSELSKVLNVVFGFGRRSCPGNHFAEANLFAFISTVLASCTVYPAKDAHDRDVIPEVKMTSNLIMYESLEHLHDGQLTKRMKASADIPMPFRAKVEACC